MPARLMLHRGARPATRDEVARVATPDHTRTWFPIPHAGLLDGVQAALERVGLRVIDESHGLGRDGNRLFSLLRLSDSIDPGDFKLAVGVRNSHDRSIPAGLVVGATVMICDNLSFSGSVKLARKHTAHIARDLPQLIDTAVGRLGDLRRSQELRFASYKQHELTDAQAHDLFVNALDARVLPVTRLPLAIREWRAPRHFEFREGGKTAWRFFNAVTEVLKGTDLQTLPRRTTALHGLLDATCGLASLAV